MTGYPCFQLRDGLESCRASFIAERRGEVAFMGHCAGEIDGWACGAEHLLKNRFPGVRFRFSHHFGAGDGVLDAAARIDSAVSGTPPGLVFLDFTGQDPPGEAADRCMETVIRQLRLANPAVDIAMVHRGDQSVLRSVLRGHTDPHVEGFERLAEHYQLPSVNFARYAVERRSIDLFDWLAYCPDGEANTPLARKLNIQALDAFLSVAWADPAYPDQRPRSHLLPPPRHTSSSVSER